MEGSQAHPSSRAVRVDPPSAVGVIAHDLLADLLRDPLELIRRRAARAPRASPETPEPDELAQVTDRLERTAASGTEVFGGGAFAPDARPAGQTLGMSHAHLS
jgi:hypothetical protein